MADPVLPNPWELNANSEVYLEIGYGTDPAALRGNRTFTDGRVYLGVDAADGDYYTASGTGYGDEVLRATSAFRDWAAVERPGEDIRFAIGDASSLPLPDLSVHEVYAANFINAPIPSETKHAAVEDAKRSLKIGGLLVARVNWDHEFHPSLEIEKFLAIHGLFVWGNVKAEDSKYAELEETFGTPLDIDPATGYMVIAEKIGA